MTGLRVLYVEDEPDIRTIAILSMTSFGGFTVQGCASGQEALPAAEAFRPDILVLDVMMPGMNGPDLLARLRAIPACATTPVIFMTAKVQSSEVEGYIALGALGVIAKPFDPLGLSNEILALWKTRHGA